MKIKFGYKNSFPATPICTCIVVKRTDERTLAKDPPKKDAIPRSEVSKNHSKEIRDEDCRNGNDSEDERVKEGQSSRTHLGIV